MVTRAVYAVSGEYLFSTNDFSGKLASGEVSEWLKVPLSKRGVVGTPQSHSEVLGSGDAFYEEGA